MTNSIRRTQWIIERLTYDLERLEHQPVLDPQSLPAHKGEIEQLKKQLAAKRRKLARLEAAHHA